MKNIDFTIDQDDLKCLFIHTTNAYKGLYFNKWVEETKKAYSEYAKRDDPKTFSQWINGQIIALC